MKLVGTKANRAAVGARVRLDVVSPDGGRCSIHRVIGGGSSFGGNSLAPTVGLGDASSIEALTVSWPGSTSSQTFRDVEADRSIEITEGSESYRVLPRPGAAPDAGE